MMIGIVVLALTMSATPPKLQADAPTATSGSLDLKDESKPICRRYAEVGSNIVRRKICMSKKQWDAVARNSQETGRNMQPALTAPGS